MQPANTNRTSNFLNYEQFNESLRRKEFEFQFQPKSRINTSMQPHQPSHLQFQLQPTAPTSPSQYSTNNHTFPDTGSTSNDKSQIVV